MQGILIQIKANEMMCSVSTKPIEKALSRFACVMSDKIKSVSGSFSLRQTGEKMLIENLTLKGRSL